LPLQIGFLVAQFFATPATLGIYYFAFQITLGISGLIAVPLARVSLSTLGEMAGTPRARAAMSLCTWFGAGMICVAALATLVIPLAEPYVAERWQAALPATLILLASLPARMMTPVVDAYQQAQGRWWQGTAFNVADIVGTALAALTILTGDVLVLVFAMTLWKVLLSQVRTLAVFGSTTVRQRLGLTLPLLAASVTLCLGAVDHSGFGWLWAFASLGIGAVWLASERRKRSAT
jgi:hypothetical protein